MIGNVWGANMVGIPCITMMLHANFPLKRDVFLLSLALHVSFIGYHNYMQLMSETKVSIFLKFYYILRPQVLD